MRNRNRKISILEFTRGETVVGDDIETIGRKLDNVRGVLHKVYPDTWAHRFWRQVEAQLVRKMNFLLIR
jgi:hypothetical protein